MKLRSPLAAAALVLALCSASLVVAEEIPEDNPGGPIGGGDANAQRVCATEEPSSAQMDVVESAFKRWVEENGIQAGGQIKVAWHVIYSGSTGNIPQSQIDAQISYMNSRYAGTGFSFVLASVDRTNNNSWWTMTPGTAKERNAKNALAVDPAHRFNVYTCKPGQGLLGWATFPWSYAESNKMHGVVIHYGSVPGGYLAPFNLGGTLAHEAGHYLGLYHTFQGGCTAPGDYCDDTPFEASPASGCPEGRNTCSSAGNDPIHNYMDYSDDACYTEFTANQITRMQTLTPQYRPSLLNAALVYRPGEMGAAGGSRIGDVAFRIGPNPFTNETNMRFTLSRGGPVSLKVYNVAGQLVQTLVDGDMPAGEQSVTLSGRNLPAGMYFSSLRVAGQQVNRTVMLVR